MTPNLMPATAAGTTLTCGCGAAVTVHSPPDIARLLAAVHHRWNLSDDGKTMTCRTCKETR